MHLVNYKTLPALAPDPLFLAWTRTSILVGLHQTNLAYLLSPTGVFLKHGSDHFLSLVTSPCWQIRARQACPLLTDPPHAFPSPCLCSSDSFCLKCLSLSFSSSFYLQIFLLIIYGKTQRVYSDDGAGLGTGICPWDCTPQFRPT